MNFFVLFLNLNFEVKYNIFLINFFYDKFKLKIYCNNKIRYSFYRKGNTKKDYNEEKNQQT